MARSIFEAVAADALNFIEARDRRRLPSAPGCASPIDFEGRDAHAP